MAKPEVVVICDGCGAITLTSREVVMTELCGCGARLLTSYLYFPAQAAAVAQAKPVSDAEFLRQIGVRM